MNVGYEYQYDQRLWMLSIWMKAMNIIDKNEGYEWSINLSYYDIQQKQRKDNWINEEEELTWTA